MGSFPHLPSKDKKSCKYIFFFFTHLISRENNLLVAALNAVVTLDLFNAAYRVQGNDSKTCFTVHNDKQLKVRYDP